VKSTPERGTRFDLTVPAKVSKERVLVFRCGGALYGIPSRQVRYILRDDYSVENVAGGRVIRSFGEALPLLSMSRTLGLPGREESIVLVVETLNRNWAFSVASILGEFELVRQPVDELVAAGGLVSASASLDDGELVLVLTVATLTRRGEQRGLLSLRSAVKGRVLAVDDSAIVRDLVGRVLSDGGFDVEVASDGHAALEAVEKFEPDLIVTDLEMPVMDGFELLERVRARKKYLPVIVLSSRGSPEDLEKASRLGADTYIMKSNFEPAALLDAVRAYSGSPQ
jgi:CheY-like chemotaxis protein/chemotaxis signal transduction protein